jgi:hypothetical protein
LTTGETDGNSVTALKKGLHFFFSDSARFASKISE